MKEPLPLATIHEAVLHFLQKRDDAVLFGAQAVNAYVDEPRMTQDVDILSTRAAGLAEEIRSLLAQKFAIAVRIREVSSGQGFRIFQLRQPKNRHLVDVRQTNQLPPNRLVAQVRVPVPEELIAQKIISVAARANQPKADTDRRDLKLLLLTYPHFKDLSGVVMARLITLGADLNAMKEWTKLVESVIELETPEDEF